MCTRVPSKVRDRKPDDEGCVLGSPQDPHVGRQSHLCARAVIVNMLLHKHGMVTHVHMTVGSPTFNIVHIFCDRMLTHVQMTIALRTTHDTN